MCSTNISKILIIRLLMHLVFVKQSNHIFQFSFNVQFMQNVFTWFSKQLILVRHSLLVGNGKFYETIFPQLVKIILPNRTLCCSILIFCLFVLHAKNAQGLPLLCLSLKKDSLLLGISCKSNVF